MDTRLTYENFHDWLGNHSFQVISDNYKYSYIVSKVDEFLKEEDIKLFYPRNIFDEKESELILLTDNKFILVKGTDSATSFNIFKLKDVEDFSLQVNSEKGYDNLTLEVLFSRERKITFVSNEDANEHWRSAFVDKIKSIYNVLLNS